MLRIIGGVQQPVLGLAERLLSKRKPPVTPVRLPKGFDPVPPTSEAQLDATIAALQSKASEWVGTSPKDRAKLLRACLTTTLEVAKEAAAASTDAKGSYGQGIGEELVVWVPVVSGLREYAETLEAGGSPKPNGLRRRADGQVVVDVFPIGVENLLYGKFKGEAWIEPGKEPAQGALYKAKAAGQASSGAVGLVLGAGNQLPVVFLDILHKLVADDEVVCCKMNPVNEYLGPYIRRALKPLVDAGYVEVVYGGGPVGKYLCNHPDIASVHLTGSAATHDAIVWQGKPKHGKPPFTKPVGAELGCVTPYIVVPGPWSEEDIEYHADSVAAGLTNNAGHNCLAAELVVTDRSWPLRDRFMAALRLKLAALPNRIAYYPGSDKKTAAFMQRFESVECLGSGAVEGDGEQLSCSSQHADVKTTPWLLKAGLTPDQAALEDENWSGCLQEVCLDCGGDPTRFMAAALDFANNRCWGTLSCSVFVHPTTQRQYQAAFEELIAGLQYGAIAVNVPSLLSFVTTKLPWGAFPGSTPQDIGSGNCFVHNTMLFDHLQKGVLYAPWHFHPHPFWSPSHRNLEAVGMGALKFNANPGLGTMLPLAGQALVG